MNQSRTALVRRLRSKRGMASALIIMLLVLLVFFAVLTLVTSAADLRLAQKRASWNQAYYEADGEALAFVADLDQFMQSEEMSGARALQSYLAECEQLVSWQLAPDADNPDILVLDAVIAKDSDALQGISARLEILTPDSLASDDSIAIVRWEQWQPAFDYGGDSGGLWKG